jgi:hypothetical protein
MRRAIIATAILCILAIYVACKPNQAAAHKASEAHDKFQTTVTSEGNQNATNASNTAKQNTPEWCAALKRPEWWLVFVGIIGIGAAIRTLKVIEKQADTYVAKERARITIEVNPIDPVLNSQFALKIPYRIRCWCPTPAFVVDAVATARLTHSDKPFAAIQESIPTMEADEAIDIPKIITQSEVIEEVAYIWGFDEPDIKGVQEQKLFIHFRGFITYRDIFNSSKEAPHRVKFHYCWHHEAVSIIPGMRSGKWLKFWSKEENSET